VLDLPGIGRYTAGAICSIAFNQPTPLLDGNVIRVFTRLFGIEGNPREKATNEKLWALAGALAHAAASTVHRRRSTQSVRTTNNVSHLNQSLMELGALICTPKQPRCGACPVAKICVAYREGRVHALPNLPRRTPPTTRRFIAFIAQERGRFLVRQRPAGVVNAHYWEFPNVEVGPNRFDVRRLAQTSLGTKPASVSPFCVIKHSITRYRITIEVFRVSGGIEKRQDGRSSRWVGGRQINLLPFTSAHGKILERALHPDS
jgi:A/G-specific adenine glycosylase